VLEHRLKRGFCGVLLVARTSLVSDEDTKALEGRFWVVLHENFYDEKL
jgi:hypothetical protein